MQNFKGNGQAVLVLALGEQNDLGVLLISLLGRHQNFPGVFPLIQLEARAHFIGVIFFILNIRRDHFY